MLFCSNDFQQKKLFKYYSKFQFFLILHLYKQWNQSLHLKE